MSDCHMIAEALGIAECEAGGLALWDRADLEKVLIHLGSPLQVADFIQKLRAYCLPEGVLPFAPHREPFHDLAAKAIMEVVVYAVAYPEKVGRLTNIIREILSITYDPGSNPIVIEVHFDVEKVASTTVGGAIRCGFEPDGFAKFVPAHYEDHYTLKFVVRDRERFRPLRQFAEKAFDGLVKWLTTDPTTGYIEAEIWGGAGFERYAYHPVTGDALTEFPLADGAFEQVQVPLTMDESERTGVALDAAKAADIHVKTPLAVLGRYADAESPSMNALRKKLVDVGFYEVITEAGHKIYTAQFISMGDARQTFRVLDRYFERAGGAISMTLEPCVGFWRKPVEAGRFVAVPPLVRLR